jgi:hypothetical protein
MSRKHFIAIADALGRSLIKTSEKQTAEIAKKLGATFQQFNERVDMDRFVRAVLVARKGAL